VADRVKRIDRIDVKRSDVKRTPQGGIVVPAYVTRIGVFDYGDGVLELRHPEDVFDAESLATLQGAPVVLGHPDVITSENWRQYTVGHLADDVRADGIYVAANARIQDAAIADAALDKVLREFSCGYECDHEAVSGEYEGQPYNRRQRNIRYNHVGIGGNDWGRAGPEVRVRVDGQTYPERDMAENQTPAAAAPETVPKSDFERLAGENAALKARIASLETETTPEKIDSRVKARVELIEGARKVLGEDAKFDGKSDAEIRKDVAAKAYPDVKLDGKSDDFVAGLFASAVSGNQSKALEQAANAGRVDAKTAPTGDKIKNARDAMIERNKARGTAPLGKVN
jgi:hypothetical protein